MRCTDCGHVLSADPHSETLRCPQHGSAMARIERNALWDGEVVAVVCPTRAANGRYVVQFPTGKRRTVKATHLRPVEMEHPA